jgi:hypothetical protein
MDRLTRELTAEILDQARREGARLSNDAVLDLAARVVSSGAAGFS